MKKLLTILFLVCVSLVVLPIEKVYAFGGSEYEVHHIFPREHFAILGDQYCFKLTENEHKWVTFGKGFHEDWKRVTVPSLSDGLIKGDILEKDSGISNYAQRQAAIIAGMRILSYHTFMVNYNNADRNSDQVIDNSHFVATTFDFWGNLYYNLAYIVSLPAKMIHYLLYAVQNGGLMVAVFEIPWVLKEAVLGLGLSLIMLIIGPVIGFLCHPAWSIGGFLVSNYNWYYVNLLTSIFDILYCIVKGIWIILFW